MRRLLLSFDAHRLLLVFIILLLSYFIANSECPECFFNTTPMAGHGAAEDGSGRRTILIQIHSSWGAQTNPTIWNRTEDARVDWNNTTDQYGNRTGY